MDGYVVLAAANQACYAVSAHVLLLLLLPWR
jgi:hypothetical protein